MTGAARFEILEAPPAAGSTRARLGRLHLPHGDVETPTFLPVGTNATVKALHPDEIEETGAQIILANTYHLYLRPGHERIARLGGLHRFMSWPHPILTDSGGFQVVSLGDLNVIDDDGVTFQSHHDGSRHRFTAERSMEIQAALGADVAVAFDQPVPPASTDPGDVAIATERTNRWAVRSLEAHHRPDQALFGVIQGGLDPDLRRASSAFIAGLPFDGLNIGGLAGDETPAEREAVLDVVVAALDRDPRVRYLMGLGSPADLLEAVHRGVDLFDSVLPARVARNGQLWIPGGHLNIRNERFRDDPAPVQEGCRCLLCRRFSRAYLRHLFVSGELLGMRLASVHAVHQLRALVQGARQAILEGRYGAFRATYLEKFHSGETLAKASA